MFQKKKLIPLAPRIFWPFSKHKGKTRRFHLPALHFKIIRITFQVEHLNDIRGHRLEKSVISMSKI